jgi:hypothetical protein
MISAKIIADSVSEQGKRITTFQLRYQRFIHSEFMTHRMFSRNASSSRAIPVKRQIKDILKDMAMPIHWGQNKPGMQANSEISKWKMWLAKIWWIKLGYIACITAYLMSKLGCHKQITNRILEPFSYIHVVVTATEWTNFFALRYHYMAQPEIYELAKCMYEAYEASEPKLLKEGEWHLPYVGEEEYGQEELNIKASVARCARVSYVRHDGKKPKLEDDLKLHDRLLGHRPVHASPAEHQATPAKRKVQKSGNFVGWLQYRKRLNGENITEFKKEDL